MKYNGMRILSNQIKGEPGGLAKLIVKLQACELAHQISALAIDAMGELGILYNGSVHEREHGSWQWNYMFQRGLIIGGGTAQSQKKLISDPGLKIPREPRLALPKGPPTQGGTYGSSDLLNQRTRRRTGRRRKETESGERG